MSRISDAVRNGNGLVCFITAGYPSAEESIEQAMACVRGGASVIEIGVPFSDPVADGKVIQLTSQKALEAGMTPLKVFDLVKELRTMTDVPVVLMGYYNPIFRIGEEEYASRAKEVGVNGLIVPDLPMEESGSLSAICRRHGLDLIQLVGPTTSEHRMRKIVGHSSGFLYVVSSLGTTGSKRELPSTMPEIVARAKRAAGTLPVAVGFGISRPEHVDAVRSAGADGFIVGSSILERVIRGEGPHAIEAFVRGLADGANNIEHTKK